MCNEIDPRLIYNDAQQIIVSTVDQRFIGANGKRVGILLMPASTNRYNITFKGLAVLDTGIIMFPNTPPLLLHFRDFGFSIREEIRIIASGTNTQVNFVELMTREELVTQRQ
jgi:hypothetical protein